MKRSYKLCSSNQTARQTYINKCEVIIYEIFQIFQNSKRKLRLKLLKKDALYGHTVILRLDYRDTSLTYYIVTNRIWNQKKDCFIKKKITIKKDFLVKTDSFYAIIIMSD